MPEFLAKIIFILIVVFFFFRFFLGANERTKSQKTRSLSHSTSNGSIVRDENHIEEKFIEKKETINSEYNFTNWKSEMLKNLNDSYSLSDLLIMNEYSNINYGDLLKCFEWKYKRLTILLRDEFKCKDCLKKDNSNHIHHEYYLQDKLPWDIEDLALVTLCHKCHISRHQEMKIPVYKVGYNSKTLVSYEKPSCSRCGGTGYLAQYKHVENGICFKCRGNLINKNVFLSVLKSTYNDLNKYEDKKKRAQYSQFINNLTNYELYCKIPNSESYYDDGLPF